MLYLHSVGHFHPENILDNQFLESLDIGVDSTWIAERVGIERRRTVLPLDYIRETRNRDPREANECATRSNQETAALAARCALVRAGLVPGDIGMVVSGSCSPQSNLPAEACGIAARLGITGAAFDLNAGCASFAAQMHFLSHLDAAGMPDFVLVVAPENNTRTVDYSDRSAAVLWGDGTTAAIVSKRVPGPAIISDTEFVSDPAGSHLIGSTSSGHFRQDGHSVQTFAVRRTTELFQAANNGCNNGPAPRYFVGHQANLRMLESACRRANVQAHEHLSCVADFGNCGAAGAPSVISMNWEMLRRGSTVLLAVVGAGLSWGRFKIQFQEQE
jgi:3-oxoacyl-[acyl-carrier-protein] synthase-3